MRPYIIVKLKEMWHYDKKNRRFYHESKDELVRVEGLPKYSWIVPITPDLSTVPHASLMADEANLARHIHIILPHGTDVHKVMPLIGNWTCVELVSPPREVSLP